MADANVPQSPPEGAKLRAADLALLEEDARRFLLRDRPATDALWMALQKPRDRILAEYAFSTRRAKDIAEGSNAGLLEGSAGLARLGGYPSTLVGIAETVAAKALLGDMTAASLIFDRIEGGPTKRRDDSGATEHEQRLEVLQSLEDLVRAMNERPGMRRPGDGARDITPPNGHDREHD